MGKLSTVVINEREEEPLSEFVINFLKHQKKESSYLDFKLKIDLSKDSDFPEIVKDILAFSNYGGGWILVGWKEEKKSQYFPVGMPENCSIDQSILQEKFNSYIDDPIVIEYKEIEEIYNNEKRRFGFVYIPPSRKLLVPIKEGKYTKDGKERLIFNLGTVYYRRGTQNINPSKYELELIEKRLKKENYKLSFLSGEPDEIDEEIYSNLFEIKNLPKYIYIGEMKNYDHSSIKFQLNEQGINPAFYYKFKEWNKKLVTFENLEDDMNPYSKLVKKDSISRELVSSWLSDIDKSRIIMELLNRELFHYAIGKGFYYDKNKLFYPLLTAEFKREQSWGGRYRKSSKVVAASIYADKLKRSIFWHASFFASFVRIQDKIFLEITPTFTLTDDGRKVISGFLEGTIITSLSYDMRNNNYLNNILFWIEQLKGDNDFIKITDYLEIDIEPSKSKLQKGIIFDLPSSEFKIDIEEEENLEDNQNDF
ncbi:MAG: ATP-binding protein [Nanobdellota archaeon]